MQNLITSLVQELLRASSFEEAAVTTLHTLLKTAHKYLQKSTYHDQGTIQRGIIHLRPAGGYRGLVAVEHNTNKVLLPDDEMVISSVLPSTTAWQLVENHNSGIAVDIQLGVFQAINGSNATSLNLLDGTINQQIFDSSESLQRLLSRGATHLFVLPMYGPGRVMQGVISLETCCHPAKGQDFIWTQCADELQLIADLATPTIVGLPLNTNVTVEQDSLLPVVGSSMANLMDLLKVFSQQDETIFISGPTGAGKSRLAAWCHSQSLRRNVEFSAMNLLTVPENMQMAYLTGWVKGAFTDAHRNHQGFIDRAEGGTLFIDEIDKLSLNAQAGLLELLESRQYQVLGDSGDLRRANVRIIVGTNIDLQQAVEKGHFRRDLYFRINVLPVYMPGLEERLDEIPAWARFMVARRNRENGKEEKATLSADAALALTRYPWPGNLRQLDNVIRRSYALALAEYGPDATNLDIKLRHIEQALNFETQGYDSTLTSALKRAAIAFVDEALAYEKSGKILSITHAGSFKGLVLQAAQQRFEDLKRVYKLFGRQKLVDSRNHDQDYQREAQKVTQFSNDTGQLFDFGPPRSSDKQLNDK